ncbi:hypothetical protein ARAM_001360 [Aspergillus rambellii]|uniref:Heat shock factor binding protein n=2 Tax=Aspergillus subgen. Nidulantes TaxID=2720870 RepID=A0A0F8UDY4_9EURO|nr:hypothetical protein ARAM_001360 [Aspergillus rambellii]
MPDNTEETAPSDSITPPISQQTSDAQGEFAAAVDELLDQLQHKFDTVSREMSGKLDDMTRRLDELEASLSTAGDTGTPATVTATATTAAGGTGSSK